MSTIHATAVLVGPRAVLIRGAAGSGKSTLAFALLRHPGPSFARLIGDDRLHVEAAHGRLLVRPAEALKGLIEIRGLGIRQVPFEPVGIVGLVVDLNVTDAERLPEPTSAATSLAGITLPRLAVAPQADPLMLVFAALRTGEYAQ